MDQTSLKTTICILHMNADLTGKIHSILTEQCNILSYNETNEALTQIKERQKNLIIILGAEVENPLHIAITIHNTCYLVPVFIFIQPERLNDLQRELNFNPFASTQIYLLSTNNWQDLPKLLNSSLELTRDIENQIVQLRDIKITDDDDINKSITSTIWQ